MATGNDYIACEYNEFVKIIKNIQNSREDAYVNIGKSLNNKYIDVSKNISKLNDERIELLNKIKFIQLEYRHLMGEGEITPSVDIDDNSDDEEKIIVEPKAGVRGRKKKTDTEKTAKTEIKLEEEPEPTKIEEPVGETKKNKVKKTTKKEEVKEEVKEEEEVVEEEVVDKVKGKKGKKK
jgi:hypothetical protein